VTAAALSLVVLTLNVSGPRRLHQGWPTRREAITARLKAEGADVAAFQEVWRAEDLAALGEAAGHEHRVQDESLGLAVTSRLPIESHASRAFGGGYGALRARLTAGKSGLDAYSARLEPGEGVAAARRLGQMFRLAEFIRSESAARPFVLLGDLGVAADERDSGLLLDLIEGRDLCVSHGDEVCGRTLGDRRVDYAVIPYSSRPPRENAGAEFIDLLPEEGEEAPTIHFILRARLDANVLRLKPAASPPARDEALEPIADALSAAVDETSRGAYKATWIPFYDAYRMRAERNDAEALTAVEEEARSAIVRDAKHEAPSVPQ